MATAWAFEMLRQEECAEVAKPEWWNDQGLKTLSARVVRVAWDVTRTHSMRADVLSGQCGGWEVGPRLAAEFKEAAVHYDRSAALSNAPAIKAAKASNADWCRSQAEAV